MITRRFNNILDELEGLIKNELWSASCEFPSFPVTEVKALVAVSGGMDSMCLADLYCSRNSACGFAIAHCNFNLRGDESDADEAMVREWADARGVEAYFISFDTKAYAQRNGLSIEMAARELRYQWFGKLCREKGFSYVAVAHHADDNAETMMLNLVRGTGLKGMSGMKPVSRLPYSGEDSQISLLRPLLGFTRKQLEGYVLGHKVPYRNDSTNASVEYRRNSIRHEIFPVFERMNPSYAKTLNREMRYFSDAQEIVEQWCRAEARDVVSYEGDSIRIDTDKLMARSQWRYLLYHILEPYGFPSAVLASIEDLLSSDRTVSGKEFSNDAYVLLTGRDSLRVLPAESVQRTDDSVVVEGAGLYALGNVNFIVEVCPWSADMPLRQPEGVLAFDADALGFPFVCRHWKRGDWMVPFGMKGRKKLSDIFADMKWEASQKNEAVVIASDIDEQQEGNRVAALLGVRMDDRYRIKEDTSFIIRIRKQ